MHEAEGVKMSHTCLWASHIENTPALSDYYELIQSRHQASPTTYLRNKATTYTHKNILHTLWSIIWLMMTVLYA